MRIVASIILVSGVLLSLPSLAETVDSVQGQVSINRGDGFRPVTDTVQVKVGDSVMASPGGRARVVYPDGCTVDVNPGAVVTITESPCKAAGLTPLYVAYAVVVAWSVGSMLFPQRNNRPASP